jgi:hypothetical protein
MMAMASNQHVMVGSNLSQVWARAFLHAMERGVAEVTPLMVSITGLSVQPMVEEERIRLAIDSALREKNESLVHTVANTIFPQAYWKPDRGRQQLFDKYIKNLPFIKGADRNNSHGLYFERMIAFGAEKKNQLEHIISTYKKGNRRRSALQAAIFDPFKDHKDSRQLGFPCLQQVAFAPSGIGKKQLTVTGFYATQHLFEKAYGNYLGLYRLGTFMAHEMGLELERVNCIASVAKRGNYSKQNLAALAEQLQTILEDH